MAATSSPTILDLADRPGWRYVNGATWHYVDLIGALCGAVALHLGSLRYPIRVTLGEAARRRACPECVRRLTDRRPAP